MEESSHKKSCIYPFDALFGKETSHSQVQSLLFPWINSLNKALVEANQNIHLRPRQWACCTLEKRPNSSSISSESLSDGSSPVLRRFSFRSWRGSSRPPPMGTASFWGKAWSSTGIWYAKTRRANPAVIVLLAFAHISINSRETVFDQPINHSLAFARFRECLFLFLALTNQSTDPYNHRRNPVLPLATLRAHRLPPRTRRVRHLGAVNDDVWMHNIWPGWIYIYI